MSDLAAARRAHAARLAGGVRRKIVVQHEMRAIFALERVDDLLILAGAQGRDDQRLGFAAGEQRRAVSARQHADLGLDRPHRLGVAAVDAWLALDDRAAHDFLFDFLEHVLGMLTLRRVFEQRGDHGLGGVDHAAAHLLLLLCVGIGELARNRTADLFLDDVGLGRYRRHFPWLLGRALGKGDDRVDHRLEVLMAEHHRAEHDLFAELARFGFNHQHAFLRAGDHEVELRTVHFVQLRIQHIFAVDITDARAADRAQKRNAGNGQRRRRADHRDDVGIVLEIVR